MILALLKLDLHNNDVPVSYLNRLLANCDIYTRKHVHYFPILLKNKMYKFRNVTKFLYRNLIFFYTYIMMSIFS